MMGVPFHFNGGAAAPIGRADKTLMGPFRPGSYEVMSARSRHLDDSLWPGVDRSSGRHRERASQRKSHTPGQSTTSVNVGGAAYVHRMHHPWRTLRAMTDWTVTFTRDLPDGMLGCTDAESRTIYLRLGLTQAQRRATLAHELAHAVDPLSLEHCVDQAAVRRLIPLQRLADALAWSRDEYELARELWVDVPTVRARLEGLTEDERDDIERRLAAIDG